ncbi:hypothetical protein [Arenibaculum pallidiluteum]|uniref:hypothetical protein n=1 Tax=Arenibaculum pallidiluteum TaxID=2812559 RepID=UPI001A9566F2|nr:hypothetical protein [Arenibaculum pallidiluteum]
MRVRISRRGLLAGGIACGALAAVPLAREGTVEHGLALIRRQFGPGVAADPAVVTFLEDYARLRIAKRGLQGTLIETYLDYGGDRLGLMSRRIEALDDDIVQYFVLSTNILQVVRTGARLDYAGFYDPYDRPCANPLSAFHRDLA